MTPDQPAMPLTLEFTPENLYQDEETAEILEGIVLVQPSRKEEGRIFVGVNPFGKNVGCHLLPEEARRVRDHLNILLLEPSDEKIEEVSEDVAAAVEANKARIWTPEQLLAYKQRREAPRAPRFIAGRRTLAKLPRPQFRLEFKWGAFEALLVRLNKRG